MDIATQVQRLLSQAGVEVAPADLELSSSDDGDIVVCRFMRRPDKDTFEAAFLQLHRGLKGHFLGMQFNTSEEALYVFTDVTDD